MNLKPATRQGVRPLIGLYSESGCGKTFSALHLARGFVGASGKIGMIDTESGRGSLYADVVPGGYDVLELNEPFTPERYIEAVQAIEAAGVGIGIIDSISHEWEGIGGVLDQAAQAEARTGKPGLHIWRLPKLAHARFVGRLLQSPIPWIVCMRAKHKSRQVKNGGRTEIIRDDFTTPIQADDFIFEMTVHGEIQPDHTFRATKAAHPGLAACFPAGPITVQYGKALAEWCASAGKPKDPLAPLKARLWKLTTPHHGGSAEALEKWLLAEGVMRLGETLSTATEQRLEEMLTNPKVQNP